MTPEPLIKFNGASNDGEQLFFERAKIELLEMLSSKQPEILDPVTGTPLPKLNIDTLSESQINSLVRFYAAIKEAQRWQTHAKWDKLAFFTASLSVGEGVLYLPGYPSSAPEEEIRLKTHFLAIMECIGTNLCVKKWKMPMMTSRSIMPHFHNPFQTVLEDDRIAELMKVPLDLKLPISEEFHTALKTELGKRLCFQVTLCLRISFKLISSQNGEAIVAMLQEIFDDRQICTAELHQTLSALPTREKNCNLTFFEICIAIKNVLCDGVKKLLEAIQLPFGQSKVSSVRQAVNRVHGIILTLNMIGFTNMEDSIYNFLFEYNQRWINDDIPLIEVTKWHSIMLESAPLTVNDPGH